MLEWKRNILITFLCLGSLGYKTPLGGSFCEGRCGVSARRKIFQRHLAKCFVWVRGCLCLGLCVFVCVWKGGWSFLCMCERVCMYMVGLVGGSVQTRVWIKVMIHILKK